jgi:hypothetical protein
VFDSSDTVHGTELDDFQRQQQQRLGVNQLAVRFVYTGTSKAVVRWRLSFSSADESIVARVRKLVAGPSCGNYAVGGRKIDIIERKWQAVPDRGWVAFGG